MELWSYIELLLFVEYEQIANYVAALACEDDSNVPDGFIRLNMFNEAKLLIINKDVIGYIDGTVSGIYTFKEATLEFDKQSKLGNFFNFHPVNFTTENNYLKFFNQYKDRKLEF